METPSVDMGKDKSASAAILTKRMLRGAVCIFLCIISLMPFYLLFVNCTRSSDMIKTGISLIPSKFFLQNYNALAEKQKCSDLTAWRSMINSFIICVPSTAFTVYFSSMTAYGVHVYNFKLKKVAWGLVMGIMMVPGQISIIGFYRFMLKLHLTDSYIPLILPAIAAPSTVFFMRQYMQSSLSLEIIEAARIDGAGEFRTFNTIVLPLMKPAMATQAIFGFIANWNNLFTPTIMLTSAKKYTLPMFVSSLSSDQFKTDYGIVYMGLALAIIPIVIVYALLSKFIVAGVALGGVKE